MGNGLANIVAAALVSLAILWNGGLFQGKTANTAMTEAQMTELARAVGDIRNDVVVNCGCCGESEIKTTGGNSF